MSPVGNQCPQHNDSAEQEEHNGLVRRYVADHAKTYESTEDENTYTEGSTDQIYDSIYIHIDLTFLIC